MRINFINEFLNVNKISIVAIFRNYISYERAGPNIIKLISAKFTLNFCVTPDKTLKATLHFSVNYSKISFIILGPGHITPNFG